MHRLVPFLFAGLAFLASPPPAPAQSIPPIGTDASLDVATWNIEWFGSPSNGPSDDGRQFENVRTLIEEAEIDLWAVQEIADEADFATLVDSLSPLYDGRLATHSGPNMNDGVQRIGFIYRTDVFRTIRRVSHILEEFSYAFAYRPPLLLEAEVVLPDTTLDVTFIVVHMKASSDTESHDRRSDAAVRLKTHLDFGSAAGQPAMVLGDFNDRLTGSITSGRVSPYTVFIDDGEQYFFPSLSLEEAGEGSFCSNTTCTTTGNLIDHILITDELWSVTNGIVPGVYTDAAQLASFGATTSDHLPVYARFHVTTGTAREAPPSHEGAVLLPPYPSPFRASTVITYRLAYSVPVHLELIDMLGRRVLTIEEGVFPPGQYERRLDGTRLPPGVYLLRLQAGLARSSRPLIRLP